MVVKNARNVTVLLVGWHLLHQIVQPFECKCPVRVNRAKSSHEVTQVERKVVIRLDRSVGVQGFESFQVSCDAGLVRVDVFFVDHPRTSNADGRHKIHEIVQHIHISRRAVGPQCDKGYGKVDCVQYSPLISAELSAFGRSPVSGGWAHPRRQGRPVHILFDVVEDVYAQNRGTCFYPGGAGVLWSVCSYSLGGGSCLWCRPILNQDHEPTSEVGRILFPSWNKIYRARRIMPAVHQG